MKFKGWLNEDIIVPINIGDVVLGGKFKNKKITVKKIGKNPKGDITINGKPLLKYRTLPKKIDEQVTNDEATGFVNKWKAKLKSYGVTEFKLSTHFSFPFPFQFISFNIWKKLRTPGKHFANCTCLNLRCKINISIVMTWENAFMKVGAMMRKVQRFAGRVQ